MPFSGPLGAQYATLVGIVTAIAFDPLAHGRARRRHDRNRQNTTCRELQSFMRFWRVTEADNVWEDNRGDELNALLPGAQSETALLPAPFWCTYAWNRPTSTGAGGSDPLWLGWRGKPSSRSAGEATPRPSGVNWNDN